MITRKVKTTIKRIEHKTRIKRSWTDKSTNPPSIKSEIEDLGWFIWFEGSFESMHAGYDEPKDLYEGQKIIIEYYPEEK